MSIKLSYDQLEKRIRELEAALLIKPWIIDTKEDAYEYIPENWYQSYLQDGFYKYDYPILITGETGTCKDALAYAIHKNSERKDARFLNLKCSAIPRLFSESHLFDAAELKSDIAIGSLEKIFDFMKGGTVFFDDINELSVQTQIKLAYHLNRYGPALNVQIVAGSKIDLRGEIQKGDFDEDLFYQINVIPVEILPLRKRKADIPELAKFFISKESAKNADQLRLSKPAEDYLGDYLWPGNLIELQKALQYGIVKCTGNLINVDDLPLKIRLTEIDPLRRGPKKILDIDSVKDALNRTSSNKAKAARLLGVGRATLYRFLDDHPYLASGK